MEGLILTFLECGRRFLESSSRCRLRSTANVRRLCDEAGVRNPEMAASLFYLMLERRQELRTCLGTKQIGELLVQPVDLMVESRLTEGCRRQRL